MTSEINYTLTNTEYNSILQHLYLYPRTWNGRRRLVRDRTLLVMMWETGLRVSEMVRLRRSDLQWNDEIVRVLTVREEIAKKGHERRVPISVPLKAQLLELSKCWFPERGLSEDPFAFQHRSPDEPLTPRHVQRLVRLLGRAALNRNIHPHMFRHSFATRMMRVTNARVVQQLLGHRHLSSTQIYTHPGHDDLRAAIDAAEVEQT